MGNRETGAANRRGPDAGESTKPGTDRDEVRALPPPRGIRHLSQAVRKRSEAIGTNSKASERRRAARLRAALLRNYFGGAGGNTSGLRPGPGLGFGFGAFLTSFLPLSLFPMRPSMTQNAGQGQRRNEALTGRGTLNGY